MNKTIINLTNQIVAFSQKEIRSGSVNECFMRHVTDQSTLRDLYNYETFELTKIGLNGSDTKWPINGRNISEWHKGQIGVKWQTCLNTRSGGCEPSGQETQLGVVSPQSRCPVAVSGRPHGLVSQLIELSHFWTKVGRIFSVLSADELSQWAGQVDTDTLLAGDGEHGQSQLIHETL